MHSWILKYSPLNQMNHLFLFSFKVSKCCEEFRDYPRAPRCARPHVCNSVDAGISYPAAQETEGRTAGVEDPFLFSHSPGEFPRGRVLSIHIPGMPPGQGGLSPDASRPPLPKARPNPRHASRLCLAGRVGPRRLSPRAPALEAEAPTSLPRVAPPVTPVQKLPIAPAPQESQCPISHQPEGGGQ